MFTLPILICILFGLFDICFTIRFDAVYKFQREVVGKITKREFGKKFVNLDLDIINSYINVSLGECIWKCYTKSRCQAIEYRTRTKYCALVWKYGEVDNQPGSYIVHGFVNKVSRQCGGTTCNRKETCLYKDNKAICAIEECSNPLSGNLVVGNVFSIGGKIISKCSVPSSPSVVFVCSSSGEWWTTAGPQDGLTCTDLVYAKSVAVSDKLFIVTNQLGITLRCFKGTTKWWMIRRYGVVDFYRDWEDYKYGFGHVCGDYWMGLEIIHSIMQYYNRSMELRVILNDWNKMKKTKMYSPFRIGIEEQLYRLAPSQPTNIYPGDAGNALISSYGMPFSTYDRDNDNVLDNCAAKRYGSWWYNDCQGANLNGKYYKGGELIVEEGTGVTWFTWHGYNYSLYKTELRMN